LVQQQGYQLEAGFAHSWLEYGYAQFGGWAVYLAVIPQVLAPMFFVFLGVLWAHQFQLESFFSGQSHWKYRLSLRGDA
jgi:hypothetical protein